MFSIIIPVYNDKKIKDCLNSIFACNFLNKEVIVVDNNSNDQEIKKIINNFPVKYIFESHKNSYISRNTGAKNAQGKILIFIDSDCVVDEKFFNNIQLAFQKNIDGLMGKIIGINKNNIAALEQKFYEEITGRFLKTNTFLKRIDTRNFAIKKEIFLKHGGFSEMLKYGSDMEFGARLHEQKYKIIYNENIIVKHINETDLNKIVQKRIKQNYDNYHITEYHNLDFLKKYFPHLLEIKKYKKYYLLLIIGLPILKLITLITRNYWFYKKTNIFAIKLGSLKCYLKKSSPIQ